MKYQISKFSNVTMATMKVNIEIFFICKHCLRKCYKSSIDLTAQGKQLTIVTAYFMKFRACVCLHEHNKMIISAMQFKKKNDTNRNKALSKIYDRNGF